MEILQTLKIAELVDARILAARVSTICQCFGLFCMICVVCVLVYAVLKVSRN